MKLKKNTCTKRSTLVDNKRKVVWKKNEKLSLFTVMYLKVLERKKTTSAINKTN